jgi:hypothetical protein
MHIIFVKISDSLVYVNVKDEVNFREIIYKSFDTFFKKHDYNNPLRNNPSKNFIMNGFFKIGCKGYNFNETDIMLDGKQLNNKTIEWIPKMGNHNKSFTEEEIKEIRNYLL